MKTIVRQEDIVPRIAFVFKHRDSGIGWSFVFALMVSASLIAANTTAKLLNQSHSPHRNSSTARVIYDRYGAVVLGNYISHDLVMVPQYLFEKDMTFKILSRLLHIPES